MEKALECTRSSLGTEEPTQPPIRLLCCTSPLVDVPKPSRHRQGETDNSFISALPLTPGSQTGEAIRTAGTDTGGENTSSTAQHNCGYSLTQKCYA